MNINQKEFQDKLEKAKQLVYKQVLENLKYFKDGVAHVSEDGIYPSIENNLWTASFYPGMTYLAFEDTKDEAFLENRQIFLDSFKERCLNGHMVTHDIGFLFMLTYLKDYSLFGEEEVLDIATKAADLLVGRYHAEGGFIQAWGPVDPATDETRIIIDTMMNVEFLYRMAEVTGKELYKQVALDHCDISAKTLIREDGSSYHTYFLKKNGDFVGGKTHQGHQDESTWARGQAWAVYGYSRSYLLTGETRFLDTALKTAKVFIENLPKDFVHYWDFDFTDANPDIRDSSAASIGAMGLLLLHEAMIEVGKEEEANEYKTIADEIMNSLIDNYMIDQVILGQGILREGMYHRDEGFEEFTSWGDYYFLEAIMEYAKLVN